MPVTVCTSSEDGSSSLYLRAFLKVVVSQLLLFITQLHLETIFDS